MTRDRSTLSLSVPRRRPGSRLELRLDPAPGTIRSDPGRAAVLDARLHRQRRDNARGGARADRRRRAAWGGGTVRHLCRRLSQPPHRDVARRISGAAAAGRRHRLRPVRLTSYIAARPPRHFSLYDYGAGFADHLEATRPKEGGGPLAALPAAVARLERARAEVQRAEGLERRAEPPLMADAAMLPGLRLKLPDSVRLLRLGFDLLPLIDAADRGGKPVVPEAGESLIAVARSHYRVRLHKLEPWHHAWLEALGPTGRRSMKRPRRRRAFRDGTAARCSRIWFCGFRRPRPWAW